MVLKLSLTKPLLVSLATLKNLCQVANRFLTEKLEVINVRLNDTSNQSGLTDSSGEARTVEHLRHDVVSRTDHSRSFGQEPQLGEILFSEGRSSDASLRDILARLNKPLSIVVLVEGERTEIKTETFSSSFR